ncbi:hypothetical protein TFKS16_1130 [Tannerella forsythia KS16]|nr:hypothetical protein TF3313_0958 [Tannerella forsythia 3313]BAR51401.1 hypothetical protein TFKS16_1130 [Tannerella forsythia KS16]
MTTSVCNSSASPSLAEK